MGGENLAPAPPLAASAQLLDSTLAVDPAVKSGYTITYVGGNADGAFFDTYTINANPTTPGATGVNYFYTDQTTVIRKNPAAKAGAGDPPIQ